MELHKVPVAEMRGFDKGRLKELRHEIQRELVKLRMDVYSAKAQHSARIRGLRKTLARVLTVTRQTVTGGGSREAGAKPQSVASKPKAAAPKSRAPSEKVKAESPRTKASESAAKAKTKR